MTYGESVFMRVEFRTDNRDALIEQIKDLGLGEDLILQRSEITFREDENAPGLSVFSLVIDSSEQGNIEKCIGPNFSVSFEDVAPLGLAQAPSSAPHGREYGV